MFHDEIIPQFNCPEKKKLNHDMFAKGIWLFAIGLFKKVMIADTLGRGADYGFTNIVGLSGLEAVLVMLCYSLQIYFDFSGYCDMASGIGNMFQVEFPLNFDSPYKSLSITEFWTHWHITLTRFLRKYVYIPLGGSKKGNGRTLVNIMIVYLISGIWHGAAWTFVLWGVLHGIARVIERMLGNRAEKIPSLIRWFFTFLFVNLSWILFRAETVDDAFCFYERLLCGWSSDIQGNLFAQFELLEFTYVVEHVGVLRDYVSQFPWIYMMIVLVVSMMIVLFPKNCHEREFKLTYKRVIGTVIMLVWSILSFSGISTFLYFNF